MSVLAALGAAIGVLRIVLFWTAVVVAAIALLDWLVRTRRLSPFSPPARFARRFVDPAIAPVERIIVRAGGLPTSAPWWALVFVVVGGLILLYLLEFLLGQLTAARFAAAAGPRGVIAMIVGWVFAILQIALIVRVVSSWVGVSPYSRWVYWTYRLTEPILRPLRGVIPTFGMLDLTPLVAYFLLVLLQRLVMATIL